MQTQEKIFYQDEAVTITQSRFVSKSKTYAMSNISSVSIHRISKSRIVQVILCLIGLLCIMSDDARNAGIVMLVLGGIWLLLTKDEYSVRINSNSGEADGFISKNQELIQNMVNAVNEAIIHRG